jgi:endonuclease/exonuclease/phosphatase family metal-dependent hydrolase
LNGPTARAEAASPAVNALPSHSSSIPLTQVTVASYNIHKALGLDRRVDLGRIAAVLAEIDADVVGVQEIFRPQAERLAQELGVGLVMGVTHERAQGPYGNAILTRLDIQSSHVFDLTRQPREPRGGVRVDVALAGKVLHLFNVHFGLRVWERAQQVKLLVQSHVLSDEVRGPRIVMGDLNEWFPGPVGRTLRGALHGPRIRRTHPSPLPLFALDRIYWDRVLHGDGIRVHRSRLARVASDHLPIVARLHFPSSVQ